MKDKQMKIIRTSMFTGKERTKDLPVTQKQLDDWKGGMVIQEAMPHLSVSDREFIMTGVTDDEWNETFKESENQ